MAEPKRKAPTRRKPASGRSAAPKRSSGKRSASSTPGSVSETLRSLIEQLREPRIAAALGVVLAAAIILLLVLGGDDDGGSESSEARGPEAVSVDELQDLPDSVDHTVYWAGERPDVQYELTVDGDGNIFIRYLEPDVAIGARDVAAFTVGTYPVPDAEGALQNVARQPGAIRARTPDGAQVLTNESNPQSVYIAYPGSDYQIEVYDPDAPAALKAATSGKIEPLE
jgi:hypothetical protein